MPDMSSSWNGPSVTKTSRFEKSVSTRIRFVSGAMLGEGAVSIPAEAPLMIAAWRRKPTANIVTLRKTVETTD
jgi:hypothetical protein